MRLSPDAFDHIVQHLTRFPSLVQLKNSVALDTETVRAVVPQVDASTPRDHINDAATPAPPSPDRARDVPVWGSDSLGHLNDKLI